MSIILLIKLPIKISHNSLLLNLLGIIYIHTSTCLNLQKKNKQDSKYQLLAEDINKQMRYRVNFYHLGRMQKIEECL